MDAVLRDIASFVGDLRYEDLPETTIMAAKRALVDALGCAAGGYGSEPARIARDIAAAARPGEASHGAQVLFCADSTTTPELAAFANGVMIRVLDYNDSVHGPATGGHPSDYIAAALAVAEDIGADGKATLLAIVVAYEIFCRYLAGSGLGSGVWDQVVPGVLASAGATAGLLGLDRRSCAEAVSLAIVPNLALQETRLGVVSMWKGCAAANASRNGIFAAYLAARGVTGPGTPFEGRGGIFAGAVEPFEPPRLAPDGDFAIERTQFKKYPIGSLAQSAVTAAAELHEKIADPDEIASVEVLTNHEAIRMMAGDREKWTPSTRESADHSLPYVVAEMLSSGLLDIGSLESKRYLRPQLVSLMARTTVGQDDECNAVFPAATMAKLTVRMTDGATHQAQVTHHRGHPLNPMSETELTEKFTAQAAPVLGPERAAEIAELAWRVDDLDSIDRLIRVATAGIHP